MAHHTFFVTFKSETATLSGHVTALNSIQAIGAAIKFWGVKCDGDWSAEIVEKRRAA